MKKPVQETAADLSHHIRNQLTYIMLSADSLYFELQNILTEKQAKDFRNIDVAVGEIRSTLDHLTALLHSALAEPQFNPEEIPLLNGG